MRFAAALASGLVPLALFSLLAPAGCAAGARPAPNPPAAGPAAGPPQVATASLDRTTWNLAAQELGLPLLWARDANHDGRPSADELAIVWGMRVPAELKAFVPSGGNVVTGEVREALDRARRERSKEIESVVFEAIARHVVAPPPAGRAALVRAELAQSRPTLVETDLTGDLAAWKPFVTKMEALASRVDQLFATQVGAADLEGKIAADDAAARTLFFRNRGPDCLAPKTQNETECTAIAGLPRGHRGGLYPKALLGEAQFCERLTKSADRTLMGPFNAVHERSGKLVSVPYPTAFQPDMDEAATLLRSAAEAIPDPKEQALKEYLLAAAQAFRDNSWFKADEAWAKMGVDNSKWYVRVAPDETYSEPCNAKAMFHMSFGLINQTSVEWQKKLSPLKMDMEKAIGALAGAPYKARPVSFKLPDFVNITLNAGDSRSPSGVTIGQSLPNFGPVANEGRGRTVAMTNFYQDADSVASLKSASEALFCGDTMALYATSPEPLLMSTVLHEAAHNLGPAHQYKVGGKTDREVFGGPLASTLEELKAQTAALYFADWLAASGKVDRRMTDQAHVRDLAWAFGHVSRGMVDESQHPRPYSQLAAIQLGFLMGEGALSWKPGEKAANGADVGCFTAHLAKFPEATRKMLTVVAGIKGRGDRTLAEKLVTEHVNCAAGEAARCKDIQGAIAERVLRQPKPTFLYSLRFE